MKSFRSLGVTACSQLQSKKVSNAALIISDKVACKQMLGVFENSLSLANYEQNLKKDMSKVEEPSEEGSEEKDPRMKKHLK